MESILSLSYGKDSLACIGACEQLGWKIDRIIHAEIWATEIIPADLPPMWEFKKKADKIIKEKYGITVEHVRAKETYESIFYKTIAKENSTRAGEIYGFPRRTMPWCNTYLKKNPLHKINRNALVYIGIAADEPKRFKTFTDTMKSPLAAAGWTEKMCYDWCVENDLLSPIYTTMARGGCWFCHNQTVDQLRQLRRNYPRRWELLQKWDAVSLVKFKYGLTVADFEKRFAAEEAGIIPADGKNFRWDMIKNAEERGGENEDGK